MKEFKGSKLDGALKTIFDEYENCQIVDELNEIDDDDDV